MWWRLYAAGWRLGVGEEEEGRLLLQAIGTTTTDPAATQHLPYFVSLFPYDTDEIDSLFPYGKNEIDSMFPYGKNEVDYVPVRAKTKLTVYSHMAKTKLTVYSRMAKTKLNSTEVPLHIMQISLMTKFE